MQKEFRDPTLAKTLEALAKVFSASASGATKTRSISRIHFHSLKFHIIAQKLDAPFADPTVSLAAGSLIATSQACNYIDYDLPHAVENSKCVLNREPRFLVTDPPPTHPLSVFLMALRSIPRPRSIGLKTRRTSWSSTLLQLVSAASQERQSASATLSLLRDCFSTAANNSNPSNLSYFKGYREYITIRKEQETAISRSEYQSAI